MHADEYQRLAGRTLIETPDVELATYHAEVAHNVAVQCANTGHIAEYVKKGIFHKQGFDEREFRQKQADLELLADVTHYPLTDAETFAAWNVLGLCGEAGEVAALVDRAIAARQPIDRDALRKELGDVLWYVAALATKAGLELGDIMQANIDKLRTRYPDGYTAEASAARADERVICAGCGNVCVRAYADTCDHGCGRLICADCWAIGEVICAECMKNDEDVTC